MLNISTLNTVIAVVIVLLVLSLIVQSIQSLVKKVFKLKSSVFFYSMIDLFEYIDSEKLLGQKPDQLVGLVKEEFRKLGRETLLGRPMFDSISKTDLLKIVNRLVQTHPSIDKTKLDPANVQLQLEEWFETVMQGFNERYNRNMKTAAVVIAFLVVVVLNANIFSIYKNIASSEVLQSQVMNAAPQIQKQASSSKDNPTSTPAQMPSTESAAAQGRPSPTPAGGIAIPNPGATPKPSPTSQPNAQQQKAELKQNVKDIQDYMTDYKGFGFSPLTPQQVGDFVRGTGIWAGDDKPFFWVRLAHGLKVLLGWLIMTLLLSVGAPFWQDALESLFGLKGLIRQKGETRNVEQGEGGQEKP
jgi:hypothetical protein